MKARAHASGTHWNLPEFERACVCKKLGGYSTPEGHTFYNLSEVRFLIVQFLLLL